MQVNNRGRQQAGISTIAAVAALSAVMVTFLIIFLLSNGGTKDTPSTNNTNDTNSGSDAQASSEPPYIRIPQSSYIYSNDKYGFSFAYPNSFQGLKEDSGNTDTMLFRAESALADQKPVGKG